MGGSIEEPEVDDPALEQALTEVIADLDAERLGEARRKARALLSDATQIAPHARLLLAVANLREGQAPQALTTFEDLARDDDLDPVVRRAAMLYRALVLGMQGKQPQALRGLEAYEGSRPSTLLLAPERAPAMTLLALSWQAQGDKAQALAAWSWVYQFGDPAARLLARGQSLDMLRRDVSEEVLLTWTASEDDFTRGYTGAALLLRATADFDQVPDSDRQRVLGEWFRQTAPALSRLQDQELIEEVALRLAHMAGPQAVRVGLLLPLSGKDRRVGQRALAGALVAQGVFRPGAGPRSTILIQDTGSSPEGARRGVQSLVSQGASLILGPLDNGESLEAAREAEAASVPLIALSLEREVVTQGPQVFRLFWDEERELAFLLARAAEAGVQRLGIMHPEVSLSTRLAERAQDLAPPGMKVVSVVSYDPGASDFRKAARAIKRSKVDAVFVPDLAARVSRVLPFLATENLWCGKNILCLGNATWSDARLLQDGGDYAKDALIATSYSTLAPGETNQQFVQAYQAMIGTPPDMIAAFTFDALRLARLLTLERRASSPEEVQAALADLGSFDGVIGPLVVEDTGEIALTPLMLTVQGDKMVPWKPAP